MSHPNQEVALSQLNNQLEALHKNLLEASHIMITLGTAWVYSEKSTKQVVANCHKVQQNQFDKKILSVNDLERSLKSIISSIQTVNPHASIVWTVSPVRHQKDGLVENQRSKSHLFSALYTVMEQEATMIQYYFPSYELLMDELRDYRFYANDLLHPSDLAVDFIWQRFSNHFIDQTCIKVMKDIYSLKIAAQHRPVFPDSVAYQNFKEQLFKKEVALKEALRMLKRQSR
jgi:hypothetical protein